MAWAILGLTTWREVERTSGLPKSEQQVSLSQEVERENTNERAMAAACPGRHLGRDIHSKLQRPGPKEKDERDVLLDSETCAVG